MGAGTPEQVQKYAKEDGELFRRDGGEKTPVPSQEARRGNFRRTKQEAVPPFRKS